MLKTLAMRAEEKGLDWPAASPRTWMPGVAFGWWALRLAQAEGFSTAGGIDNALNLLCGEVVVMMVDLLVEAGCKESKDKEISDVVFLSPEFCFFFLLFEMLHAN